MAGARCQAAVRVALEIGYRHIDTATMYRNERDVGRAVRASGVPRQQVFLTKLPPGAAGRERHPLDNSLRALGMDYVDLWLVHWPPRARAPGLDLEGATGRPRRRPGPRRRDAPVSHNQAKQQGPDPMDQLPGSSQLHLPAVGGHHQRLRITG
jgi:hypothetical protein